VKNREGRRISETLTSVVGFLLQLSAALCHIGLGRTTLPEDIENLLPELNQLK
jgi:hypothetical protein